MQRLSVVEASWVSSELRCAGFSLQWLLCCWAKALDGLASVTEARRSLGVCSLPGLGTDPWPLHWQVDSRLLCRPGSPTLQVLSRM